MPRATEWLAGEKPSWRSTSNPTAGTAQPTAPRERSRLRERTSSTAANATAAATQIHALVEVMTAAAARNAATFIRPLTAASPAPVSRVVTSGSTTADPDVNRKTGFTTSSAVAMRACRALGARA